LRLACLCASLAGLLVAPYIVNCWRTFGDPLYAINAVTPNLPDGQSVESRGGAFQYVRAKLVDRPVQMIDIAILGLTEHPFTNRWDGFQPWLAGVSRWLALASIAGLLLFLRTTGGRLLLLVMVTATVPFSLTWQLASDWRYTEHAYPFFLIATALAVSTLVRAARPSVLRDWRQRPREYVNPLLTGCAIGALAAVCAVLVAWGMPVLLARETLKAEGRTALIAGTRDLAFYRRGWSQPVTSGNVTQRFSDRSATLWFPLEGGAAYHATLRLDPFPRPFPEGPQHLPRVRVMFNGAQIALRELQWNPELVGSYDVSLPATLVNNGVNRLDLELVAHTGPVAGMLVPRPGLTDGAAIGMWYVLLSREPPQASLPTSENRK
jgi:hypothetical protein